MAVRRNRFQALRVQSAAAATCTCPSASHPWRRAQLSSTRLCSSVSRESHQLPFLRKDSDGALPRKVASFSQNRARLPILAEAARFAFSFLADGPTRAVHALVLASSFRRVLAFCPAELRFATYCHAGFFSATLFRCTLVLCTNCTGRLLNTMSSPPRPTALPPSTMKRAITRRQTGIRSEPWSTRIEPTNSRKRLITNRDGLRPSHNRRTYARFTSESC